MNKFAHLAAEKVKAARVVILGSLGDLEAVLDADAEGDWDVEFENSMKILSCYFLSVRHV